MTFSWRAAGTISADGVDAVESAVCILVEWLGAGDKAAVERRVAPTGRPIEQGDHHDHVRS